jgi:hypothetical protein
MPLSFNLNIKGLKEILSIEILALLSFWTISTSCDFKTRGRTTKPKIA